MKPPKRIFRIIDLSDKRHPFGLVSPDDEVIRVDVSAEMLADHAFETLCADRVTYNGDSMRSDSRFQPGETEC